jgi:hypothetical protein
VLVFFSLGLAADTLSEQLTILPHIVPLPVAGSCCPRLGAAH